MNVKQNVALCEAVARRWHCEERLLSLERPPPTAPTWNFSRLAALLLPEPVKEQLRIICASRDSTAAVRWMEKKKKRRKRGGKKRSFLAALSVCTHFFFFFFLDPQEAARLCNYLSMTGG